MLESLGIFSSPQKGPAGPADMECRQPVVEHDEGSIARRRVPAQSAAGSMMVR